MKIRFFVLLEFDQYLRHHKTFPTLLSALACMILRVAILVELRLVTDGQTDADIALVQRCTVNLSCRRRI